MQEKELGPVRAKIREKVRKFIILVIMLITLVVKPFRFLHKHLPYKIRELVRAWDVEMITTYLFSLGTRAFMDQNCKMKDPPTFQPLVRTDAKYQFTEEQIRSFYQDGFIGPVTLWTREEMDRMRPHIEEVLQRPSAVYPKADNKWRDRHIDCPEFWDLIASPQIKERLAQLLGPDLMIWRSQVFMKKPGDPEVTWHQASTYMAELKFKATLEPADRNPLYQLTTWIAIDDADVENGCMHFLKGTHRKMWTMRKGGSGMMGEASDIIKKIFGSGRFAKANVTLEIPLNPEMVVAMPLKAGQCVIFTERCIHGSPPNESNRRRFGLVFRTIRTDVQVYRDETEHAVTYLKESFDLKNWGCMQLRGGDQHHLNRMLQPPAHERVAETVS